MTTQNPAQDASDATPDLPWRDISELEPSDDKHWFLRRDGFGNWVIDGPRATQNHSEDEEDGWQWFASCESPPLRARELQQAQVVGEAELDAKAKAMFDAQKDPLAAPWERQWSETTKYWREKAATPQSSAPVVGVTDEMVERACRRYAFREDGAVWPDAYSENEVAAERGLMRELLESALTGRR